MIPSHELQIVSAACAQFKFPARCEINAAGARARTLLVQLNERRVDMCNDSEDIKIIIAHCIRIYRVLLSSVVISSNILELLPSYSAIRISSAIRACAICRAFSALGDKQRLQLRRLFANAVVCGTKRKRDRERGKKEKETQN